MNASEFIDVTVDTGKDTLARVESIPKDGFGNGGDHVVDAKLFVTLLGDTGSTVYPVTRDGIGDAAFTVPGGDSWHFERVR